MPEMTLLGWFHTILGVLAVLSGFYTLYKYRVISFKESSGKLYILVTLLVAGSALGIYNQGGLWGGSYSWCVDLNCSCWRIYHGAL